MVNLAVFNSNFGEWKNQKPGAASKKADFVILPGGDLTLLKVDDYEDFLVMDVINQIEYLFGKNKVLDTPQTPVKIRARLFHSP